MAKTYNYTLSQQNVNSIICDVSNHQQLQIDLDPPYQRAVVWETKNNIQFIESLISGIFPGSLTFNIEGVKKTCVDGKQRITSIIKFINNEFPITIDGSSYFYTKHNKHHSPSFSPDLATKFLTTKFNIIEYHDLPYEDQIKIFNCIQYGKRITDAELIKSKFKLAETSKTFDELSTNIKECFTKFVSPKKEQRNEHQKLLLQILYVLSLNNELTSVTTTQTTAYLETLEKNLHKHKEITTQHINIIKCIFSDSIMGNHLIKASKMKISILLAICFTLNSKFGTVEKIQNESKHIVKSIVTILGQNFRDTKHKSNLEHISDTFMALLNGDDAQKQKKKKNISSESSSSESNSSSSESESSDNAKKYKSKKSGPNKMLKKKCYNSNSDSDSDETPKRKNKGVAKIVYKK